MNKVLSAALLISTVLFFSCSKKSDPATQQSSNKITINGKEYTTVVIGSQTWTEDEYVGAGTIIETLQGGLIGTAHLYTHDQATAISLPKGWRLPSVSDYNKLIAHIGGGTDQLGNGMAIGTIAAQIVISEWPYANGSDTYKFTAAPLGFYNSAVTKYQFSDAMVAFWTSTSLNNGTDFYGFGIDNIPDNNNKRTLEAYIDYYKSTDGLCVRFVKDN